MSIFQREMDHSKPFNHAGFNDWRKKISSMGGKVSMVIEFPNEHIVKLGNPEIGLKHFQEMVNKSKRKSLDWVNRDVSELKKLSMRLSDMKQCNASVAAPHIIRHFMGKKGKYGECI